MLYCYIHLNSNSVYVCKKFRMCKILHISKNKIILGNKFSGVLFRVIVLNASDVGFMAMKLCANLKFRIRTRYSQFHQFLILTNTAARHYRLHKIK